MQQQSLLPEETPPGSLQLELLSALIAVLDLLLISLFFVGRLPAQLFGLDIRWTVFGADILACCYFWWEYLHVQRLCVNRRAYRLSHGFWLLGAIPFLWPLRGLQIARLFKPLRHLRLGKDKLPPWLYWARALMHKPVELLGAATLVVLILGATILYFCERSGSGTVRTWWDALWLCATSATTDSYGDVAPTTVLGRIASITVAFIGIVLVGSFTASITSYIIADPSPPNAQLDEVLERLRSIEEKLDAQSKGPGSSG